ncbi:MAG: class I SAM-dependent methyltransferase, partial [Pseudomonadota bacterium]
MTDLCSIDDLLACPRCDRTPLEPTDGGHRCPGCKTVFPQVSDIPWLFAEPDAALGEWRRRLQFAVQQLAHEEERVSASLRQKDLLAATRRRLEHLHAANAEHRKALTDLLAPLDIGTMEETHASHLAMRTRLPSDQGLNTYYNNVHRDWVWGDAENQASVQQIESVLADTGIGDCLILGAGAGRLAYDLHRRGCNGRTIVVDFNPMLLIVAQAMYRGDSLELFEFPIAPSSLENTAVRQHLKAPKAADPGLHLILADVLRAPFARGSFDTVITPWLVDILSEDLRIFARRINNLLKGDGRWVSFGSLAFEHPDRARRYSPDEIAEIAVEAGFESPVLHE